MVTPILANIIAKGLAFVDELLGTWTQIDGVAVLSNTCGSPVMVLNASVSDCGASFLEQLTGLINNSVYLLNGLIQGLFAV